MTLEQRVRKLERENRWMRRIRFQHASTGNRIEVWHEPARHNPGEQASSLAEGQYRIERVGARMIGS